MTTIQNIRAKVRKLIDHPYKSWLKKSSSKKELQLQWLAIILTAMGLFVTCFYHHQTLKAVRLDSELASYLHLCERYHQILYSLLKNDPEVFRKTDNESLEENKYLIYEAIDLFSTIFSLEKYHKEIVKDIWPFWHKRMELFFNKPAVHFAWVSQHEYANHIYDREFMAYVDTLIGEHNPYICLDSTCNRGTQID